MADPKPPLVGVLVEPPEGFDRVDERPWIDVLFDPSPPEPSEWELKLSKGVAELEARFGGRFILHIDPEQSEPQPKKETDR